MSTNPNSLGLPNTNPLQLNPQSSAAMISNISAQAPEEAPKVNDAENAMANVLTSFRSAWQQLEDLHNKQGGDSDKFATMQKAAESWLADIAGKTSTAPSNPSY